MHRLFYYLFFLIFLPGCEQSIADVEYFVMSVKQTKGAVIEPLPKSLSYNSYEYSSGALRSPFDIERQGASVAAIGYKEDCLQPNMNRAKSLLEDDGLENLVMRGTLRTANKRWALIETNDGNYHKVKEGSYVGLFNGKVTQVHEQKINVIEMIPDGHGCWVKRKNSLLLDSNS